MKTIVVTLNLRSFNAQCIYSKLETPLQKSLVLIKERPPLINRLALSFKAYDVKSPEEREYQFRKKWKHDKISIPNKPHIRNVIKWDQWMAETGIKDGNGRYDTAQTDLACHYIKTYGFLIDTLENPRIKDFNEIIELAHSRNWNLVFNLLAENTEKANELVGADLVYLMNENGRLLAEYFSNKGITVVDNLNDIDNEQYIDQDWTTEHYKEPGRKIIAKNVAEALKTWHSEHYIDVNSSNRIP